MSRTGDVVRSHPFAGTTPRTGDPATDARAAATLLASAKDRAEHQITIDMVLDTVLPFCSYVDSEPEPSIVGLANVQHLATPIRAQLRRLGVGVDHLRINAPQESRTVTRYGVRDVVVSRLGEDYLDYRRAVIRLREAAALYNTDPEGVEFVDTGLFRAELELPAVAPTGQYFAEVWLFQDGEPVSVSNLTLTVEKVGIERDIYEFAHRRPWSYGALTVLLAALMGWGASRVFRRP